MGQLRFLEAAALAEEARALSDHQFGHQHPGLALAFEPYVASSPADATRPLHHKTRVAWPVGPEGGALFALRLGRDPVCEINLPHPKISKTHALLQAPQLAGGSSWVVEDLGSLNGTMVGDRVLERGVAIPVADGVSIVLGGMISVRPFFAAEPLWTLLKMFAAVEPSRKMTERLDFELILSALRSLGATGDVMGDTLTAISLDGFAKVRVRPEGSQVAVEWGSNDVYLKRKTVALNDPKLGETVRGFVLDAVRLEERNPPPRPQPLDETAHD